jgi:oligoribonuclease
MIGVFLDTETSGLDPYVHTVIEVAFVIVDLYSGRKIASWEAAINISQQDWDKCDERSLAINGMTRNALAVGLNLSEVRSHIEEIFIQHGILQNRAVFICQNPSFDRPFFSKIIPTYRQEELNFPYHWLDLASMYWALVLSKRQTTSDMEHSFSKDVIAKDCGLPSEDRPHRAMNGVRHLMLCYEKLIGYVSTSSIPVHP